MTWIKICGLTNVQDALTASILGADALGFIFAPSPRKVSPAMVKAIGREMAHNLASSPCKVGVFVNEALDEVRRIAEECDLGGLQLHGQESPKYCRQLSLPVFKAIAVKGWESLREIEKYPFVSILLDAWAPDRAGGAGKPFRWEIAQEVRRNRDFILSGGLNFENVNQAIQLLRPWGVDVCSGVEKTPGYKDYARMASFIREVRKVDEKTT